MSCSLSSLPMVFAVLFGWNLVHAQPPGATRIVDAGVAPNDGMAQQRINRRGGKSAFLWTYGKVSTGFFIGPDLLLTNAHNMHSPFGSRVVKIDAHSARSGNVFRSVSKLQGRTAVRSACWIPAAYHWNDFPNDYAIVRFPENGPKQTTRFELAIADSTISVGDTVFVSGYPAETMTGIDLYRSKGVITGSIRTPFTIPIGRRRAAVARPCGSSKETDTSW
ncbi:MAG: trypsin-like peptidase domain-containing protein [Flavobacteriales bacterium]|nr:trypsin-like peptidase domain-containing protein [Flavobacteriales bacterium]